MFPSFAIPEWVWKEREKYWDPLLVVEDVTQHVVVLLLDSMQWPMLERPPDKCFWLEGRMTWQWTIGNDVGDFYFHVMMQNNGRVVLNLGAYDDKGHCCNAVVGKWKRRHRFKYGWYSQQDVKRLWELIAATDANVDAIKKHCGTMDRLAVRTQ